MERALMINFFTSLTIEFLTWQLESLDGVVQLLCMHLQTEEELYKITIFANFGFGSVRFGCLLCSFLLESIVLKDMSS